MHNDENLIRCNCTLGKILDSCDTVTVSVADNNKPFDVEVQFAHDSRVHRVETLYFLCDKASPVLGLIDKNTIVSFTTSIEESLQLQTGSDDGGSRLTVTGEGKARVITDEEVIVKAASMITQKYPSGRTDDFPEMPNDNKNLDMTVVSIEVSNVIARRAP